MEEMDRDGLNLLLIAIVAQAGRDAKRGSLDAARWLRDEGMMILDELGYGEWQPIVTAKIARVGRQKRVA